MTEPSKRDRFRPAEFLGLSGVVAVFVGLVTLASTRDIVLGLIFAGVTFILTVVTIAMLVLSGGPDDGERIDLDEQDRSGH